MGELRARRDYIPITRWELEHLLATDQQLPQEERELLRPFCDLVSSIHHLRFNRHLQELKRAYDPFDPDTDNAPLFRLTENQRQERRNALYRRFAWLLEHAHFQHLCREEIEPVLKSASDWGIRMDVDFNAFEYIAIFARGDALQRRTRRRFWNCYRLEEAEVPIYRRLVLILKLRSSRRIRSQIDTENVYLKVFKDIPKLDVMMLLPGARVRLTKLDRGKIGMPLLSGLGLAVWNILHQLKDAIEYVLLSPNAVWGLAGAGIGYGYKSYYGYLQTKQAYHLTLTQSLYFQNLDSNAGVLTRLLDEAEEQETKITTLAYYCLCRFGADGCTSTELDLAMDLYLDLYADVDFDCTDLDALCGLRQLGLAEAVQGQRSRAVPLAQAVPILQAGWQQHAVSPVL